MLVMWSSGTQSTITTCLEDEETTVKVGDVTSRVEINTSEEHVRTILVSYQRVLSIRHV